MHEYAVMPSASLGERIRQARGEQSQQDFAKLLGVDQASVSRYERDEVKPGLGAAYILIRDHGFRFSDFVDEQVA